MSKKIKIGLITLCVLSFMGVIGVYTLLPETIPINWDLEWKVSRYAPKSMILFLGLLPLLFTLLMELLPKIDPRKQNYTKHQKAYHIIKYAVAILLILLTWMTIAVSLDFYIKVNIILPCIIGVLFIIIGNYMPTIKSNYFLGIKNPWTLSNDMVWKKTHKIGGYLFTVSGILFIVIGAIPNNMVKVIGFAIIIIGILSINIYSYVLFNQINNNP